MFFHLKSVPVTHKKKGFDGFKYKFFCYLFGAIIIAPWDFLRFFFEFLIFC